MSYSSESFISISWDEANQYIFFVGVGISPTEKVQAKLNEMLDLLKQKKASKILLDIREIALYSKNLETWIEQAWEPQAIAVGLKTQAFVLPENHFTRKMLINAVRKSNNTALKRAFFDSVEGAKEWLSTH